MIRRSTTLALLAYVALAAACATRQPPVSTIQPAHGGAKPVALPEPRLRADGGSATATVERDASSPLGPAPPFEWVAGATVRIECARGSSQLPAATDHLAYWVRRSVERWPRVFRVVVRTAKGERDALAKARLAALTSAFAREHVQIGTAPAAIERSSERPEILFLEVDATPGSDRELALSEQDYEQGRAAFSREATSAPPRLLIRFDTHRPGSPGSAKWMAYEKARCAQCNGDFGPHGIAGIPSCLCRTRDGGKACNVPEACESKCEIRYEDGLAHRGTRCPPKSRCPLPQGFCSEFVHPFGCQSWIDRDATGARIARTICRD